MRRLLIANRGEVALRIARAAADRGLPCVAVYASDEDPSVPARSASLAVALGAAGPAAYLDIARLVAIARETGCDAVHPGYGFLSERADFAQACADAGLVFVGPTVEQLALLGDKARALALARQCGVPVLPGSLHAVNLAEAQAFLAAQVAQGAAGVMLKAVAGGGGRGMRPVGSAAELPEAYARCQAEAQAAFGLADLYVERLVPRPRHVEVQVIGDGRQLVSLGERECTLQRQHQKLVEIAPSPRLQPALRERLTQSALALAQALHFRGLGTFEFLLDEASTEWPFVFIEANARLQVEHTVTEQVTGLDLVQLQLDVASGRSLADLGLDPLHPPAVRGCAIQWRINAETLDGQGRARPSAGTLTRWDWPGGPGIRLDTHARLGATATPQFDTLLAKLVVQGDSFDSALRRSARALADVGIEGVATNLPLLRALAARPEMQSQALHTSFVHEHRAELWPGADWAEAAASGSGHSLRAPMTGRLVQHGAAPGQTVAAGAELAVIEAMKMQHALAAEAPCVVQQWLVQPGQAVQEGEPLALLSPASDGAPASQPEAGAAHPPAVRADLQRVLDRQARTQDAARAQAVAARHARGLRTARENVAALCDEGSFMEYGALAVAAQSRRRSAEDLIAHTPADGMVTGIGGVNGEACAAQGRPEAARTVVLAYDATVLAGTQGWRNHQKTDRLLGVALDQRLPVVLFAEGGGGRPGDVDLPVVAGLHVPTFAAFARLSGQVPLVGIAAGRCFAGNAALLGCCDVIIATRGSNIGMGGPAMIEGGGLGLFKPEQVGPAAVQQANGVIDVLVEDEAQAVQAARRYLGFFQGRAAAWTAPDTQPLRDVVPPNRLRVYEVRRAWQALFDEDSVLELRAGFGPAVLTALARVEGRAVGVLASNPAHLGGAIDAPSADKAARFLQLCNAHGLPVVSLIDTPGFMVGPATEETAQVRHVSRLFVVGAALRVPFFAVVLRKGYGLGAMALAAGGFHAPVATVAWPTGEFGGMGLEGAVRLGYRKELEALPAGPEREALYERLVAQQYEAGSALNMAATLEIDAVIDPAQTRAWLAQGLAGARLREQPARFIDTW